uniref:G-protein coupled receptors family 1 profile domain-containing protein n=1 Tax=Trichuris muris TaxID=70415 RepID=A0A5S6R5I6_TRIMR
MSCLTRPGDTHLFHTALYRLDGYSGSILLSGICYIATSIRRYTVHPHSADLIPYWKCIAEGLHLVLEAVSNVASGLLILMLALDRIIAIVTISFYKHLSERVIRMNIIFIYAFAISSYVIAVVWRVTSAHEPNMVSPYCYTDEVFTPTYYNIRLALLQVPLLLTIILYIAALLIVRLRERDVQLSILNMQLKREKLITKKVSVIIAATMLTRLTPNSYICLVAWDYIQNQEIPPYIWFLEPIASCADLLLYYFMDTEVSASIKQRWSQWKGKANNRISSAKVSSMSCALDLKFT